MAGMATPKAAPAITAIEPAKPDGISRIASASPILFTFSVNSPNASCAPLSFGLMSKASMISSPMTTML